MRNRTFAPLSIPSAVELLFIHNSLSTDYRRHCLPPHRPCGGLLQYRFTVSAISLKF